LSVLNEEGLRPSSDRVRETVFNWFQTLLPGARVLDLFAGTGAFGLEALSRGAATACFVEANPRLVRSIKQVLEDWDLNGVVVESTVQDFLDRTCSESFDIVFCDPPFSSTDYQGLLGFLENAVCFKTVQCLYVEKPKKTTIVPPSGWIMHRNLQYGEVEGIVFKRELS
jgi:16S rRNA (guanine966-N2)-methyltransferase